MFNETYYDNMMLLQQFLRPYYVRALANFLSFSTTMHENTGHLRKSAFVRVILQTLHRQDIATLLFDLSLITIHVSDGNIP